jgi:cytochrome o ubiquinol oxidase operon protein cyoD
MTQITHEKPVQHGSLTSYIIGFVLSIVFTLLAYWLVVYDVFAGGLLVAAIVLLAIAQLLVQLLFFLHLGKEKAPRWNLVVFSFMVLVVVIVVGGSLWIMKNLDYHGMTPQQTDKYLLEQEGIKEP